MPELALSGDAPAVDLDADTVGRTLHLEEDRVFGLGARQGIGDDRWYWTEVMTMSGATERSVTFSVPGPDPLGAAEMTVTLQGMYDDERDPEEHVVRLRLNGFDLGVVRLSNDDRRDFVLPLPDGALAQGTNALEVATESTSVSRVALDSIDLRWTAPADALGDGQLTVRALGDGTLTATGFPEPPSWAVDETDSMSPRLLSLSTAPASSGWSAAVTTTAGRVIRFVTPAAAVPATWELRSSSPPLVSEAGADYVVVAAPALLSVAGEFAAYRRSEAGGHLRARVLSISDVYDEVAFGDVEPAAVRRALEIAAREWPLPRPRYLLLLGDSTFDPRGNLGPVAMESMVLGERMPTHLLQTAADARMGVLDGDILADIAVGRIPAQSVDAALAALAKTIAYEAAPRDGWDRIEVLLADDDLPEFEQGADAVAQILPPGMRSDLLSSSTLGGAGARARLFGAIEDGNALTTYVGHGGVLVWGSEPFLAASDANVLSNGRTPVVLAVDCLNGYFDHPVAESLGESMVESPAGAAGFVTSSAVTRNGGHRDLALAFHHAFWREPELRLGDVVQRTLAAVSARGDAEELAGSLVLLGDPALKPNVNSPPVARARLVSVAPLGALVSASASYDPDGGALDFRWEVVAAPPGASASLDDPEGVETTLAGSHPGRYRLRLRAADEYVAGPSDDLVVELRESRADSTSGTGCSVAPGGPGGLATMLFGLLVAAAYVLERRAGRRIPSERHRG